MTTPPRVIRRDHRPACSHCGRNATVIDGLWRCPDHGALLVVDASDLPPGRAS